MACVLGVRPRPSLYVIPQCAPICNALEDFCGVPSRTSEQHNDLRTTTSARDSNHFTTLYNWLDLHSPFSYASVDGLVRVSSGIVAESSANAEDAYSIGKNVADKLTGKTYGDVKLKRTEKVISVSAAINSNLLLMRVTCIIKKKTEMKEYLSHEFARKPPSLFDKGLMRKNTKSDLSHLLKGVVCVSEHLEDPHYVLDGGYLLQTVVWPTVGTMMMSAMNILHTSIITMVSM